ncbi:MAG: addiction module toxin RelE [Nanoarchaeota archaeon]
MNYEIHPDLDKILSKLTKKDKVQFEKILKKIDEIIHLENLNHYKNLRAPLQKYKRVHIGHFVLLFTLKEDTIIFRYYDHHDNVYKWRPKS